MLQLSMQGSLELPMNPTAIGKGSQSHGGNSKAKSHLEKAIV